VSGKLSLRCTTQYGSGNNTHTIHLKCFMNTVRRLATNLINTK